MKREREGGRKRRKCREEEKRNVCASMYRIRIRRRRGRETEQK
jgi:hypothetical protein